MAWLLSLRFPSLGFSSAARLSRKTPSIAGHLLCAVEHLLRGLLRGVDPLHGDLLHSLGRFVDAVLFGKCGAVTEQRASCPATASRRSS
jgi:hypothetical protein